MTAGIAFQHKVTAAFTHPKNKQSQILLFFELSPSNPAIDKQGQEETLKGFVQCKRDIWHNNRVHLTKIHTTDLQNFTNKAFSSANEDARAHTQDHIKQTLMHF